MGKREDRKARRGKARSMRREEAMEKLEERVSRSKLPRPRATEYILKALDKCLEKGLTTGEAFEDLELQQANVKIAMGRR